MPPMLEFNYKFAVLSAKYEIKGRSKALFVLHSLTTFGGLLSLFLLINSSFGAILRDRLFC